MTFNIQHGIDGSHKYNLQRAIDTTAKAQPDLVALQEVTRNHPYYNCDDQPARIAEGLQAAAGRAWSGGGPRSDPLPPSGMRRVLGWVTGVPLPGWIFSAVSTT